MDLFTIDKSTIEYQSIGIGVVTVHLILKLQAIKWNSIITFSYWPHGYNANVYCLLFLIPLRIITMMFESFLIKTNRDINVLMRENLQLGIQGFLVKTTTKNPCIPGSTYNLFTPTLYRMQYIDDSYVCP